ncbi:MAG: stage III sporulation protein AD [Clostridiales bacterium]|nr:stage III sporulation protein AD [Clostridiales bacterium]
MDIFKIVGIGFVICILAVLLRNCKPEIGMQIPIVGGIFILILIFPYLKNILDMFEEISQILNFDSTHLKIVFKLIGISYITEFGAELCKDAGENAIASKIELGGKIILIFISMPIIYSFVSIIRELVYM